MQHSSGRGRKTAYTVTENIIWLARPAPLRRARPADSLASLQRAVSQLVGEIQRSQCLKAEIAAALEARRYELYRCSVSAGGRASSRSLAAAQRAHVGSLLKYIHGIAAAVPGHRAGACDPPPPAQPLARSIRELGASVSRARRLSQDMLTQCQRPDWREGIAPLDPPRA